ncbi:MAG: hypothetical protein H7842_12370, partial [Gammaproteobacteria bacterium SHHR-1]
PEYLGARAGGRRMSYSPDSYDAWKLAYPPEWDEPDADEQAELEQHPCYGCCRFRPGSRCPQHAACAEADIL